MPWWAVASANGGAAGMFHNLLIAYFAFFSAFWIFGVDQFFFLVVCLVGVMTHLMQKRSPQPIEIVLFFLFLLATVVSATQIATPMRLATFVRNGGVYLAMFLIMLSTSFAAASRPDTNDRIYTALLVFSLQCTVVAFLASIGIGLSFKSIGGYVIPDLGSKYLHGMLNKSSIQGVASWFSEGFNRPRGLMLYTNTMAGILCASMAIKADFAIRFWLHRRPLFAILCLSAIFFDLFSIYSALSRSTWMGLVFALAVFPFAFKSSLPAKFIPFIIGVLTVGLVFASGLSDGIEARLTDKAHSNEGRGLNYVLIWEMTTSSPGRFLIGHGTQLDHPEINIPVGSHSTYMGLFFKFGALGLALFMVFLAFLYRRMLALTRNTYELNRRGYALVRPYCLCFGLIVLLVQMTFIEVDVDSSYALFVAMLMYLVIQESRMVDATLQRAKEPALAPGPD